MDRTIDVQRSGGESTSRYPRKQAKSIAVAMIRIEPKAGFESCKASGDAERANGGSYGLTRDSGSKRLPLN